MYINGKLGLQAKTNNDKFLFQGGMKLGFKAAVDSGYNVEFKETTNNSETVVTGGYKPSNDINGGVFGKAECKIGSGMSLKADGEFGNNVREATLGIKYTF